MLGYMICGYGLFIVAMDADQTNSIMDVEDKELRRRRELNILKKRYLLRVCSADTFMQQLQCFVSTLNIVDAEERYRVC